MKIQNLFVLIWLGLAVLWVSSCSSYRRVEKSFDASTAQTQHKIIKQLHQSLDGESYLILRSNDDMWHLSNVTLSEDRKTVFANREQVSTNYLAVSEKIKSKRVGYYEQNEKPYVKQTHLFVDQYQFDELNSEISFLVEGVYKFEIYQFDEGTTATELLTIAGITVGVTIAYLAILCNCPYIYSEVDQQLIFEGNLFTGSIYSYLERTDFLPIKAEHSLSETIKVSVTNENNEVLNINQLSLLTVEHELGVKVLIDQAGVPHRILSPIPPEKATSFDKFEHTKDLIHADALVYDFADPEIHPLSNRSELDLVFTKPTEPDLGKLILKVRNNNWGGLIYDEVSRMLGKRFDWYHNREENKSYEEMKRVMIKDGLLMSVSIFQDEKWKPIEYIWPTGSKAFREVVIPIDLRNHKTDKIRLKLEGGFKFWDVDQASIDFSEDVEVKVYESFAESNMKVSQEIINDLRYDDDLYMNQLHEGEKIELQFPIIDHNDENSYSYFLKGKGYYTVDKEFDDRMKLAELLRFRREGGFSSYSFKRFNEIAQSITIK